MRSRLLQEWNKSVVRWVLIQNLWPEFLIGIFALSIILASPGMIMGLAAYWTYESISYAPTVQEPRVVEDEGVRLWIQAKRNRAWY